MFVFLPSLSNFFVEYMVRFFGMADVSEKRGRKT